MNNPPSDYRPIALPTLDRRGFVKAGVLGSAGLSLAELFRLEAQAATAAKPKQRGGRTTSVIILWMRGGPSQHDMWDPKPNAPSEIRGEFAPISTKVPGIQITELLPLTAGIMDKWSIVRSVGHRPQDGNVGHSDGDQICFTGYPAGRSPDENVMPSCGSHAVKQLQHLDPSLPAYVMIPRKLPGAGAAWLGPAYEPFETQADPADERPFSIPNLGLNSNVSRQRLDDRVELLRKFNGNVGPISGSGSASGTVAATEKFKLQALDILTSRKALDAFNLDSEPESVKNLYGKMPGFEPGDPQRCGAPNWAQRMLLSRRLVEAGVRLVTVDLRWWDFHKEGFDSQRRGFLPRWDRAYTALITDLEQRGLLDSTLVVAWGEIGRTPVINAQAGRDHWPHVMSVAFAGGGVQGGRVVGSSDKQGAMPKDAWKKPHDVLATIYRHLGIDPRVNNTDNTGRPHPTLPEGTPIQELF